MDVLQLSQDISARSGGAFDVTVMPLVRFWGFGPDPGPAQTPGASEVDALRSRVGYQHLELGEGQARRLADISIDLGGVAKGYSADWVLRMLEQRGFENILVEIGGDLAVKGEVREGGPWGLATEHARHWRVKAGMWVWST